MNNERFICMTNSVCYIDFKWIEQVAELISVIMDTREIIKGAVVN